MVIGIFQRFPVQVVGTITLILMMVYLLSRKVLVKVYLKLACDQYYIDSERNPTGGIVGRTPNIEITIITIIKMVYLFYQRNRQTVVSMVRIGKR